MIDKKRNHPRGGFLSSQMDYAILEIHRSLYRNEEREKCRYLKKEQSFYY